MSSISEQIGEAILRYRKESGITQQELAKALYKTKSSICKLECGKRNADIEELVGISKVLNIPLKKLIGNVMN